MFPPQTDYNMTNAAGPGTGTNAEPTNQTADLLFRIPLWMDLSMHLLPAVALILGQSSSLSILGLTLTSRFLCARGKVQTASIDHWRSYARCLFRSGLLALDRARRYDQPKIPIPIPE